MEPMETTGTPNQFSCFIIGEGTLPIQCAEVLLHRGHKICGIISSDPSIKRWAQEKQTPYIEPTANLTAFLSQQPFDYLFSIVNNRVLPKEIVELPGRYAINYHDALLPQYAGSYATTWAIMHREATHGVTWHVMSKLVDGGDILRQCPVNIADHDTALTLNAKCYEAAIRSFAELVDDLSCGRVSTRKQNLDQRTFFPRYKRPPVGCVLSWNRCAHDIDAFIRALDFGTYPNPLGLPKLVVGDHFIIVSQIEVLGTVSELPPGTVTKIDPSSFQVSTTSYEIVLRKLLNIDGRTLSIPDVVARLGLHEGYRFKDLDPELARRLTEWIASICKHEAFWVDRLAALRPIAIPYAARNASHVRPANYATVSLHIPEEVTQFLKDCHGTWNIGDFLLAAFGVYLARLAGACRFDVGFRQNGLKGDLTGLEGFFAAYVPLRVDMRYTQSFTEVFQAVREEVELVTRQKTYARDVVARYPVLRAAQERWGEQKLQVFVDRVRKAGRLLRRSRW